MKMKFLRHLFLLFKSAVLKPIQIQICNDVEHFISHQLVKGLGIPEWPEYIMYHCPNYVEGTDIALSHEIFSACLYAVRTVNTTIEHMDINASKPAIF